MAVLLSGAMISGQCWNKVDLMQRVMVALALIIKLPLVVAWPHLLAYSVIEPQLLERAVPLGEGRRMIQCVGVLPRPS